METKACELTIKQVHEGKVVATLARLNVPDRDGDVLKNGLTAGHQLVAIKPQHKWDHVDLGVADVYENGETLEAAMEFNLAIPSAKDWFEAIRFSHEKGRRQQYSFGFEVVDHERGTHDGKSVRYLKSIALAECSPVLLGASVGSGTLSVKDADLTTTPLPEPVVTREARTDTHGSVTDTKRIIGPHSTLTDDRPWNFAIEHRQVKTAMLAGFYRNLFAVQDPGKETQRGNYRYLHHRVNADGTAGPASIVACSQILHALHKGLIPPDERQGVYAHIAQHLKDAGMEPPALGESDSYVYPYDEEAKLFLWHVDDILAQTGNIHHWRAKKGMALSQERLDQFERMDQKWSALKLLLSVKGLDRPYDEVVDAMTVEARGEAVAERLREVVERSQRQAETANRAMTETFVSRMMEKLS